MLAVPVISPYGVRRKSPFILFRLWPLVILSMAPKIALGQESDVAALQRKLQEVDEKYQKEIAELKAQIEALQKKEPPPNQEIQDLKDRVDKTEGDTAKLLSTNLGIKLSIYGYWDSVLGWDRYESKTSSADQDHTQTFLS